MLSASHTAKKLAAVLERESPQLRGRRRPSRFRIGQSTVCLLARRLRLTSQFRVDLIAAMQDYDWCLCELTTGGFGALRYSSLEGAPILQLNEWDL